MVPRGVDKAGYKGVDVPIDEPSPAKATEFMPYSSGLSTQASESMDV